MPNQKLVIRLKPRADALPELLDRLEEFAATAELLPQTAYRLAVVCEELAANIAMHGATGKNGASFVEVSVIDEADGLLLSVVDDGRPFNPLAQATPDTARSLEDREIGGLGIHFVRSMVQHIAYERCGPLNRLTARLDTAGASGQSGNDR